MEMRTKKLLDNTLKAINILFSDDSITLDETVIELRRVVSYATTLIEGLEKRIGVSETECDEQPLERNPTTLVPCCANCRFLETCYYAPQGHRCDLWTALP